MQNSSPNQSFNNMDLPIVHKLIEVYKLWQEYLPHFPNITKYSLGIKIESIFVDLCELVFTSCSIKGESKINFLFKASFKLDLLKFFVRILWEIKSLDNKKYTL